VANFFLDQSIGINVTNTFQLKKKSFTISERHSKNDIFGFSS